MARLPRLSLAGHLHHVLQRGNNRQAIFSSAADHTLLLSLIEENAKKFDVAVHAYVLMPTQFDLLATPGADDALPRMMQAVGRRYVRYFNDSQKRSGTLWEGRYRSTVLEPSAWLLPAMVCLDLQPVRDRLTAEARDYPWSSHGHYAGLRADRLITPHPLVWALGNTPFAREAAYAELVHRGLPSAQAVILSRATLGGWALGGPEFVADLQNRSGRRLTKTKAGRPLRQAVAPSDNA
ncbi:MAG: transposase [Polaromonas sp.]|nr:transposase [Polaromonas sp.]